MDTTPLVLLGFGLLCFWCFAPLIIILYRYSIVEKRLADIRNVFLAPLPPDKEKALDDERGQSAAWHYARLQGHRLPYLPYNGQQPNDQAENQSTKAIQDQFTHYHAWSRYWPPLVLIILVTGAALALTGVWVANEFREYIAEQTQSKGDSTNDARKSTPVANTPGGTILPTSSANASAAASNIAKSGGTTNSSAGTASVGKEPSAQADKNQPHIVGRVRTPILMAIWGGLVWGLYEILSRRKSGDLTPTELWDVAFRLLAAIPTGYAFAMAVPEGFAPVMAFAVSAFPYRDLRHILRRQAMRKLGEDVQSSGARPTEGHIGTSLCGLSDDIIVRLGELNIVTFYDLAYADPVRLMVRTGAPPRLVMTWIDQALLAVYAEQLKEKFTALGMPCALDVCEFYTRHCYDCETGVMKSHWEDDVVVKALADKIGVDARILVLQPMRSIFIDQQTQFLIRVWYGPQWDPKRM